MENIFITVLFSLLIVVVLFFFKNTKKDNSVLTKLSFHLKEKEETKDNERIKFFSSIEPGTNLWISRNISLSKNDLDMIKSIILENIKLNKKQFDDKLDIPIKINDIDFVLHLPLSFANHLKLQSGKYTTYESSTYDDIFYDSITSNRIQRIEFQEETNYLNLWEFMDSLGYSSLFDINKDSFKLYDMIKI